MALTSLMKSWRQWLKWAAVGAGALMCAVAVGGFLLPASLEVERERLIPAPAPLLYDQVASFHRWPDWATWWQREPFLEVEFSGPASGAGSLMKWSSKREGEGRAKITAVAPNREIALAFDFGERGDAVGQVRFEETPDRQQTRVRFKFRTEFGGNSGRRYFGLLFRPFVEKDLEENLARLEAIVLTPPPAAAEKPAAPPANTLP